MMRATCQLLTIAISARWSRAGYDNACSQASTTSHNGPDRRTFLEPPQANDAHLVTAQTGSALSKRLIPSVVCAASASNPHRPQAAAPRARCTT
jgi:hypothetical protein